MEDEKQKHFYKDKNEESPGEKDWAYFWRRVINDLTNKDLIPVKVLFFFQYATLFVLYPFLTLHMSSLGLEEWEIGINQSTAPIVAILGPPFVGIIADKIGNFKVLLSALTLINAALALLLLLVPMARETVTLDPTLTFQITCPLQANDSWVLQSLDYSSCNYNYSNGQSIPSSTIRCGFKCPLNTLNSTQENDLELFNKTTGFKTGQSFLLPDGQHFLNINDTAERVLIGMDTITGRNDTVGNETILTLILEAGFTIDNVNDNSQTCPNLNSSGGIQDSVGCQQACFVQWPRTKFCSNAKERREYNVALTFGLYTAFRVILGFASATSFIMFEGAVLAIMKQYGGDYGLQRVSATVAAMVAAPLSGVLLNAFGFRPVIYLYACLKAFSALVTLFIDLEFKKPAQKVISNLKQVLSRVEILIFFAAMLWSGTAWGYLETFLFLYLERMGGSKLLMGLTITVGGIAGLPLLIFSRPIIKRFGHVNCLSLGLLFYSLRYFGYSVINDPWQALIFEAGEAITVSLAITAASTYAVALSNLQTIASIQGIMGCLYFGIGRGAGGLIGGLLIKQYGHVETFRIFGVGSFAGAIVYFLVNVFYLRSRSMAHKGLDINNLHLTKKESVPDVIVNKGEGQTAFDGPLAINKFTDIPLDEEVKS